MLTAMTTAASMFSANMICSVVVIMMIAPYIWIELQIICQKSSYSIIGIARYAAIKLDAGCCQCSLSTAAYAAANQNIDSQCIQNPC